MKVLRALAIIPNLHEKLMTSANLYVTTYCGFKKQP